MNADGDTRNDDDVQNGAGIQNSGGVQNDGPREDAGGGAPAVPAPVPAGVLPNKAAEDDPRRWGDEPGGYDHDSWLEEQKPPHWG